MSATDAGFEQPAHIDQGGIEFVVDVLGGLYYFHLSLGSAVPLEPLPSSAAELLTSHDVSPEAGWDEQPANTWIISESYCQLMVAW